MGAREVLVIALSLLACHGSGQGPPTPPDPVVPTHGAFDGEVPENLIMLSIDTLRRDILGRFDRRGRSLTPFLDELAAASIDFEDVTACANHTHAATVCAITGRSSVDAADERGFVSIVGGNVPVEPYPPGTPMLPEFLRPHGYTSLLVSANTMFSELRGSAQGYDRFRGVGDVPAAEVWAETERLLDERPLPEPFFLHLHLFDPHKPYLPPEPYLRERLQGVPEVPYDLTSAAVQLWLELGIADLQPEEREAVQAQFQAYYEAEVQWLDDQLRDIWAGLEARGLLQDALVVLWSDHGEALWEHDYNNHARLLFDNESGAFLTIWADNVRPARVVAPVEQVDIVPTLFSLWGLSQPPGVTGVPWSPEAPPPDDRVRTAFANAYFGPVHLARQGRYALQYAWLAEDVTLSLTDLETDPDARVNLYDPTAPHPVAVALWPVIEAEVLAASPWLERDPRAPAPNWPDELTTR